MIKRNTFQRTLVFETVNALKHHPTADEIYLDVIKTHPNISRATIYRNLNQLCEAQQINKVEVPDGADRFDYLLSNHYHAKCSLCCGIFDVDMQYIQDLQKSIGDSQGFEFSGHDIIFRGICRNCKK